LTKTIPLAWDEWNVWFNTQSSPHGEIYSLKDALAVAGCLNALLRCADVVGLANLAQLVNVIAPIVTRSDALFRQSIHWPLVLYRRLAGATALRATVQCAGYRAQYSFRGWSIDEEVPYLDVLATRAAGGATLTLGVVNRHRDAAIEAELRLVGMRAATECTTETLSGPAPEARNSFEQPDLVRPVRAPWAPETARRRYTFPAHSLTMLTIPLR
jgi:alpha-N-arabinofuranosidase